MTIKTFNPENVPIPAPSYRQVAVTSIPTNGKIVALAGQTGLGFDGTVPKGIVAQARAAYQHVFEALKAAGAAPEHIMHVRHYIVKDTGDAEADALDVVDRGWADEWIKFMDEHAKGHLPPDTVLGVAGLAKKELLYEVECWAVVPAGEP